MSPMSTKQKATSTVGESSFDFRGISQGQLVFVLHGSCWMDGGSVAFSE